MRTACDSIRLFVLAWALPFLNEAKSPRDFVRLYTNQDNRIIWSQVTYLYVAAAYRVLEEEEMAREVVRKHFSKPGIKTRYSVVFKSMNLY